MSPNLKRALGSLLAGLPLCLASSAALSHTGIGSTGGFVHGFAHPLSGLDHQLAMILVGVFAYRLGGRALWLVPLTFVVIMALGGALGVSGLSLPFVEIAIALSVVVLGAVIALGVRAPIALAMALVGLFAVFHGHAHGSEMPLDASGVEYGLGFMFATALLHAFGIALGFLLGLSAERLGANTYRIAGALASIAGLAMLFGYM